LAYAISKFLCRRKKTVPFGVFYGLIIDVMENPERTITRTSLELLYHVSRELAAALDLQTLLRRILFLSLKTVQANSGSIIVVDETGSPIDSAIVSSGKVFDGTTNQLRDTLEQGLAGWVAKNKQAALVLDTNEDDRWLPRDASKLINKMESRSSVSAPLLIGDRLMGVMTLTHPQPNFFTEEHLQLIQALSDQAGIAVQNARLYQDSRRRTRVMSALAESAASINASLNLQEVLNRILVQISQALQVETVAIAFINQDTNSIEYRAAIGYLKGKIEGKQLKLGHGISGWVAQEDKGAIVPDVSKDPRYISTLDDQLGYHSRAIACVPIRSQGNVIGILEARNPIAEQFNEDAVIVLTGIGNLAGTAIKHAQLFEEVGQAHSRFRELFEDNIDSIFITDLEGRIIEANRPATVFTGFDDETLSNMSIHHFHQVDHKAVGREYARLEAGTVKYESTLFTSEGNEIPIEVFVRRININNQPHHQWIMRDITERKRLEKMRQDLFSMIYHDLRSPLANVVSGLDVLQTLLPSETDPSIKSIIEIAMRSTERVERLTQSLLDTAQLESGQQIGNAQSTSVPQLVMEALDVVQPHAENKDHEITLGLPDNLPNIMVDPELIRRVVINLLENAIKYTKPGGQISIGAQQKGIWMRIWVEDNGRGIPEDSLEKVFQKFSRVREGATGHTSGLGLGLAFCKLAVENHGGQIWVESEFEKGSRFTFTAPIA
jgi:PAS domain S-box-containing protein